MNPAITIDSPGSPDLDDALWVQESQEGYELHVYVADASSLVAAGSSADQRAAQMVETHYHASGSNSMLPRGLEAQASLLAGQPRPALRVSLQYRPDGSRARFEVSLARVRSVAKLHYAQVLEVLGRPEHEVHRQVRTLEWLAQVLLARRRAQGALALYDLRSGLLTSEEGAPRWAQADNTTLGQVIVQEAMIAANATLAEWCVLHHLPVLYRNHQVTPAAPPRAEMQQWLQEMVQAPREVAAHRARVLETVLERAQYGTRVRGHFGLALSAYLHGTSPIRRYADLVTHRQVCALLRGEEVPYSQEALDAMAQRINEFKDRQRDSKSGYLKEKADQVLARRVQQGLGTLDPRAFSRVVKLAARSGAPSPELAQEVAARCRAGSLQPLDAYHALFSDPATWAPVQADVAAFLAARPHVAASVAAVSQGMLVADPALPSIQVLDEPGGPGFAATAACWGLRAEGRSSTKKGAQQDAVVHLAFARAGAEPPSVPERRSPAAPAPPQPLPVPDPGTLDPVSELQRYCQALGAELPAYTFGEVPGPMHPLFGCQVRACLQGQQVVGTCEPRLNKKDAKRGAAADALRSLAASRSSAPG